MDLQGRRVLVTGGGRGIGRAVGMRLAGSGARVVLAARTRDEVEGVAREARAAGGEAVAVTADVADADAVRGMFEEARSALGGIDVLVTAAGIARTAPLARTDDATWRAVIETNLSGTFYCLRAALPGMMEQGFGRIIAMASIAGKTGARYIAAYAASKHGVIGLVRCGALEGAEKGVTVNAVCPGYVDTPMTDAAAEDVATRTGRTPQDVLRVMAEQSPQKRLVTTGEVAALTHFLCTDEAGGINGQALNVDGGSVL